MSAVLHQCNLLRNHMSLFIRNLDFYFMFEVLEQCWITFCSAINATHNLDDIIRAHDIYIDTIYSRIVMQPLNSPEGSASDPASTGNATSPQARLRSVPPLYDLMKRLFTSAFKFDDVLGWLYNGCQFVSLNSFILLFIPFLRFYFIVFFI